LTIDHNSLDAADFVKHGFHISILEGDAVLRIGLSEQVIPVESLPELVNLGPEIITDSVVGVGLSHISEVEGALIISVVLNQARRNDVEVVNDIRERGRNINVPIGSTIANNETLKVVSLGLLVHRDKLIVLMDLPSEVGDVYASVALS
jgi:hypothetical protein